MEKPFTVIYKLKIYKQKGEGNNVTSHLRYKEVPKQITFTEEAHTFNYKLILNIINKNETFSIMTEQINNFKN